MAELLDAQLFIIDLVNAQSSVSVKQIFSKCASKHANEVATACMNIKYCGIHYKS